MTHLETLPGWLAAAVAGLVVFGASLTLLGAIGLVRLNSFYDRIHAPTLGTSWGAAGVLLASILMASWAEGRSVVHEVVIGIFVMVTTPVTLMLLGRAALHRDRGEGVADVPRRPAAPVQSSSQDGAGSPTAPPTPAGSDR